MKGRFLKTGPIHSVLTTLLGLLESKSPEIYNLNSQNSQNMVHTKFEKNWPRTGSFQEEVKDIQLLMNIRQGPITIHVGLI